MSAQIEIVFKVGKAGLISLPGITSESTRTVNELLQKNHADYHGFFSHLGMYCYASTLSGVPLILSRRISCMQYWYPPYS